jgi:hypothetical protein
MKAIINDSLFCENFNLIQDTIFIYNNSDKKIDTLPFLLDNKEKVVIIKNGTPLLKKRNIITVYKISKKLNCRTFYFLKSSNNAVLIYKAKRRGFKTYINLLAKGAF